MNIDAFYELIRSQDRTNAEVAWQIARGQKSAGEAHFADFVKAVYSWTFGDLKGYGPIEFLMSLHDRKLHCKKFRKKRIPPQSHAIAPLVEAIEIEALETKEFPTGLECLDQAKSLKFDTWFLTELGDELANMPALSFLAIQSRYDFSILPEFVRNKSIVALHFRSYNSLSLPHNLPEMEQLREIGLFAGSRCSDILWECHQLKHLILSDLNYDKEADQSHQFWKNAIRLKNLEELTFLYPYSYSLNRVVFPDFIYDLRQIKHLKVFADDYVYCKFTERILEMEQLEKISLTLIGDSELKILSKHPNIKKLYLEERFYYEDEELDKIRDALPNIAIQTIKTHQWGLFG